MKSLTTCGLVIAAAAAGYCVSEFINDANNPYSAVSDGAIIINFDTDDGTFPSVFNEPGKQRWMSDARATFNNALKAFAEDPTSMQIGHCGPGGCYSKITAKPF